MTDITTQKPMQVNVIPLGRVWLELPYAQVEVVRQLLDDHHAQYWVSEDRMSFNGGPYMSWVYFLTGTEASAIQQILDSASEIDAK